MSNMVKIIVTEENPAYRELISKNFKNYYPLQADVTFCELSGLFKTATATEPSVVIVGMNADEKKYVKFIKELVHIFNIPVIVICNKNENYFLFLDVGAADIITRPAAHNSHSSGDFFQKIVQSIHRILAYKPYFTQNTPPDNLLAIGSSTGGTEAVHTILASLPAKVPPIVVVQHMPPVFTELYAERLNTECNMYVTEAKNNEAIRPGKAVIAPGDFQLRVAGNYHNLYAECKKEGKVGGHCPSVDVMFESVAQAVKNKAIGVILTGMGRDGADGLLKIKKSGGRTIGQDEKTSVVYGMPKVAFDIGAVDIQAPLDKISEIIFSMFLDY